MSCLGFSLTLLPHAVREEEVKKEPRMFDCHQQEGTLITALIIEPSSDTWHTVEAQP